MSLPPLRDLDAVIFDVDGTLVDSTFHHALAWQHAFAGVGIDIDSWRLHRYVGVGGDRFPTEVAGEDVERRYGDAVRAAHDARFAALRDGVRPLAGATDAIRAVRAFGLRTLVATSGRAEETELYLRLLQAEELIDGWASSEDVDASKPSSDVLQAALDTVQATAPLVVGDSPWDCRAAAALGAPSVGLRCGGFPLSELTDAGAVAVFDDPTAFAAALRSAGVDG